MIHVGEQINLEKDEMALVFTEDGIVSYFSDLQKDDEVVPLWFDVAGALVVVTRSPLLMDLAMALYQEDMDAIRRDREEESDDQPGPFHSERSCKRNR